MKTGERYRPHGPLVQKHHLYFKSHTGVFIQVVYLNHVVSFGRWPLYTV